MKKQRRKAAWKKTVKLYMAHLLVSYPKMKAMHNKKNLFLVIKEIRKQTMVMHFHLIKYGKICSHI